MTKLLINFVKRKSSDIRTSFANLSGIVGIVCNFLLCGVKFAVGLLAGSVSVIADGVNNLFDCISNIVTLAGNKISNKPDDREHPFGYGRVEYISALIICISVFVVSFDLAKNSVTNIIHPKTLNIDKVYIILLLIMLFVKLWMAYFNNSLFKLTGNFNMKAVKQDSLNDSLVTLSTIVSLIFSYFFKFKRVDAIIGLGVSIFIFYAGVKMLKEVVSPLIGEAPPKDLSNKIVNIICNNNIVYGVHDLVINNYGANKYFASVDAEVDASADIFAIHEVIDSAEKKIYDTLNVNICIHMDPVDKSNAEDEKYRELIDKIIKDYNSKFSFHDFMLIKVNGKDKISFDLLIPFDKNYDRKKIKADISYRLKRSCPGADFDFNVEHSYV